MAIRPPAVDTALLLKTPQTCRSRLAGDEASEPCVVLSAAIASKPAPTRFAVLARTVGGRGSDQYGPQGKPGIPEHRRPQQQLPQAVQAGDTIGTDDRRGDFPGD